MNFPSVHTEGGLIPADVLDAIAAGEIQGQAPPDFHFSRTTRLTDEIAAAWADARAYWAAFHRRLRRLEDDDPATTDTRQQWIIPLLESLGYGQVTYIPTAAIVDGRSYAISHRAGEDESALPVHVQGCRVPLDQRPPSGRPRLSAHALMQEYLNHTEHLWGIVTNGYRLRLVRNSALMSRQSYVEFDLQTMLDGEHFADFGVMYRLLHRTRLPLTLDDGAGCWLEKYYNEGVEQGGRVRDRLRDGVEDALRILGNGFLSHPASTDLRERVAAGNLSALAYYRQLLRLIYRFLFLLVAEERGLIGPTDDPDLAALYNETYSLSRLRPLVEARLTASERYHDLWLGLARTTFMLLQEQEYADRLGMSALDGFLFGPNALPDLSSASITNRDLLAALRRLMLWRDNGVTRRVNYAALDVEELGSVYESLLDYHPVINGTDQPSFDLVFGTERKSTGSYYTRPELVQELIKSALEPVLADRLKAAGNDPAAQERALLDMNICDPASGSGHFLLAAARRMGMELARIRTGEPHPGPEHTRPAVRDVIRHCIYGVDKNPLAVDLCKVALWLEGHNRDKPLTFLDHHIKHGDSLVGVFDLNVLEAGIPDGAYKPVTGDDRKIASSLKKRNKQEREEGQRDLWQQGAAPDFGRLAEFWQAIEDSSDDTVEAVRRKQSQYESARRGEIWKKYEGACHLWTAAFFMPIAPGVQEYIPTTNTVRGFLRNDRAANGYQIGKIYDYATKGDYFHWPLHFPDVFAQGGFDVILGNPPWERIKLQEKEFFATRNTAIASARNAAARRKLIKTLPQTNPALAAEFDRALTHSAATSNFLRESERYPLTSRGDINTYSVFAGLARNMINAQGRAGIIVPTGIATDDTNKFYFADLVESGRLASLYDFENRERLFSEVDSRYRFGLLTVQGSTERRRSAAEFVFYATNTGQLDDPLRRFQLSAADFARINPNTRTCPIFRTRADAELTRKIYERVPVLINEDTGANPWELRFSTMFHMSNDSHLFRTCDDMLEQGCVLEGNRFVRREAVYLPLYEAKLLHQFDHRWATYESDSKTRDLTLDDKTDPQVVPLPRYWVSEAEVLAQVVTLDGATQKRIDALPPGEQVTALRGFAPGWLMGFRDITNATNERTAIFSLLPCVAVGHNAPLMYSDKSPKLQACLTANFNAIVFDFVARQKVGGTHLTFFIVKQFPVLPPSAYSPADIDFIAPRVLRLVYTAWDMQPFARDMGYDGPPFLWDEDERAQLRAELDAYYAHLYGLTRDELRYILDPADVYGEDFPGETFRVLKEKEIRQYGEYRTRRLVLTAWDQLGF